MSKPKTPDLRHDHQEFTIEHCSVLLEYTTRVFQEFHGPEFGEAADKVDPEGMRDHLLNLLDQEDLSHLFDTDVGKGILIGLFLTQILELREMDDE